MKRNFKLVKKSCGYVISSIAYGALYFVAQILARKIMRKYRVDEVSMPVLYLAA